MIKKSDWPLIIIFLVGMIFIALMGGYFLMQKYPVVSQVQNNSTSDDDCGEFCIKSFSPNNLFELHNSGTGVERTFEIFEIKTYKKIATFKALNQYMWWGDKAFIYEEPTLFTHQSDYRPWESGFGFSIKKINLETGETTILQKADSTHDYRLEHNPDGSIVYSNQGIWIDVNAYPVAGGLDRFSHPEVHSWIMDPNTGKLVSNIDNYETYK